MGFIDEFWGGRKTEKKTEEKGQLDPSALVSDSVYSVGVNLYTPPRNAEAILSGYRTIPWLRAIVNRIADSVASTTWMLYTETGAGGEALPMRKAQRTKGRENRRRVVKGSSNVVEEIESHPLLDLLESGNGYMSGHEVMQLTQTYLDLKGEAFTMIHRNQLGLPVELYPIKPTEIQQTPSPERPWYVVRHGGRTSEVAAEDMIPVKSVNPADPYGRGIGLAEAIGQELDTDEACANYLRHFFSNGATPAALVSVPGADPAELRRLASQWESQHRGPDRAHRVRFMNYDAKVETLDSSFSEQGVVELRKFSRDLCLNVFGCPPEIFGVVENSNRATIDAAGYLYAKWVLGPRLERIRTALQTYLVPQFDSRILIDYESPVEEDRDYKLSIVKAQPYSFERAEIRELAGFPSHGEIDEVYMQPLNLYERMVTPGSVSYVDPPAAPAAVAAAQGAEVIAKGITADAIDIILVAFSDSPEAEAELDNIKEMFSGELQSWGDRRLDEIRDRKDFGRYLGKADLIEPTTGEVFVDPIPNIFDVKGVETVEFLETIPMRTKGMIDRDSYRHLRKTLVAGFEGGIGTEEIAKNIKGVFDNASMVRARTIARTETGRAANYGTWKAQQQSGVVDFREWVADAVEDSRPEHVDPWPAGLNGARVGIDEEFSIAGYSAFFPGEFGEAGQDINCRCTTVPVLTDLKSGVEYIRKQSRDRYMREIFGWEIETEKAFKRRFKAQQRATLKALRSYGDY